MKESLKGLDELFESLGLDPTSVTPSHDNGSDKSQPDRPLETWGLVSPLKKAS